MATSHPPRRVEIEAEPGIVGRDICLSVLFPAGCTDYASVRTETTGSIHLVVALDTADAAREYAQMLRGAADALVEYAERVEGKAVLA